MTTPEEQIKKIAEICTTSAMVIFFIYIFIKFVFF